MKKQYQNIGSQLVNLEKNKKVLKSTIVFDCFYEKTYLDLVTPYSDLIAISRDEHGKHVYQENGDFHEYLEYNIIDYQICNYLHILIGCFEKKLKNFLMHMYCQKMKDAGDKQTKDFSWINRYRRGAAIFDILRIDEMFSGGQVIVADSFTIERRKKVLSKLIKIQNENSRNDMVNHYQNKYHYVPFFVAIHSLSLGELLTLFGMLNQNDKNLFLCLFNGTANKRYSDGAIEKFEKDAVRIQVMRNIVNHYEPIFPFIQNTELRVFSSLTAIMKKLKENYLRSHSYPIYDFHITKTYNSKSHYSLVFHRKIEKVIDALK